MGGKIVFFSITTLNDLETGSFNIKEPPLNKDNICEEIDTVITPGIVFDRCGYRIGYGKGYYDRYLKQFSKQNSNKVGLGYEFQLMSEPIPYEPHDVKLDVLITNKEVILIDLTLVFHCDILSVLLLVVPPNYFFNIAIRFINRFLKRIT